MKADEVTARMRLIALDSAEGRTTGSDRLNRLGMQALRAGASSRPRCRCWPG